MSGLAMKQAVGLYEIPWEANIVLELAGCSLG